MADEGAEYVILDACCVINLYASGRMAAILAAHPSAFAVTDYVMEQEVLRMYTGPRERVTDAAERIQLQPFLERGQIQLVALDSEEERRAYVDFAAHIDDGEAMTGAIAVGRGWAIGTDDRKARAFFGRVAPHVELISTPELIKNWVDRTDPEASEVSRALQRVRLRARYVPGSKHPLYDWWRVSAGP